MQAGDRGPCERCGERPRHTRSGLCRACRARERYAADPDFRRRRMASSTAHYRSLPPEEKQRVVDRVTEYNRSNPEQRRGWVRAWRLRTGRALPPDLVEFRRAIKDLDAAVARAAHAQGVRLPG